MSDRPRLKLTQADVNKSLAEYNKGLGIQPKTESKFSSMFTGNMGNVLGIPPAYQSAIKNEIDKQSRFGQITKAVDNNELPYTPLKLVDEAVISDPEKTQEALGMINQTGAEITKNKLGRFSSMVNEGVKAQIPSFMNLTDYTPPADIKYSFLGTEQDKVKPKQPGIVPAIQDNLKGTQNTLTAEVSPLKATQNFPLVQDIIKKRIEQNKPIDDIPYTDETELKVLNKKLGGVELTDPTLLEYPLGFMKAVNKTLWADPLLSVGWITHLPTKFIGEITGKEKDVKKNPFYKAGEWLSDLWEDRKDMNRTFGYDLLSGYGSLAGFMAANMLTSGASGLIGQTISKGGSLKLEKISRLLAGDLIPTGSKITAYSKYLGDAVKDPKFITMMQGSMAQAGPEFKQAYDKTNDFYKAMGVGLANLGYGATEILPIDRFFERMMVLNPKKNVGQIFKQAFTQGLEEGTQETMQQIGSNWTASQIYDASRPLFDGVLQGGAIGFITGFTLPVLGGAVKLALQRKDATPEDLQKAEKLMQEINDVQTKEAEKIPEIESTIPDGLPEKLQTKQESKIKTLTADVLGKVDDIFGEDTKPIPPVEPVKNVPPSLGEGKSDSPQIDTNKSQLEQTEEIVKQGLDRSNQYESGKLTDPEATVLVYHGTSKQNIDSIKNEGFKIDAPKRNGGKQKGIYVSTNPNVGTYAQDGGIITGLVKIKDLVKDKDYNETGQYIVKNPKNIEILQTGKFEGQNLYPTYEDYTNSITNSEKEGEKGKTEQISQETNIIKDNTTQEKQSWEMTKKEFEENSNTDYNGKVGVLPISKLPKSNIRTKGGEEAVLAYMKVLQGQGDINLANNTDRPFDKRLKNKIAKGGLLPIKVDFMDKKINIVDGQHRLEAYRRLGIKEVPVEFTNTHFGFPKVAEKWKDLHQTLIEEAISEGKNIPEEVLKDYPELNKKGTDNGQEKGQREGLLISTEEQPPKKGKRVSSPEGRKSNLPSAPADAERTQIDTNKTYASRDEAETELGNRIDEKDTIEKGLRKKDITAEKKRELTKKLKQVDGDIKGIYKTFPELENPAIIAGTERHKLPDNLNNAIGEMAKDFKQELENADVTKVNAFSTNVNVVEVDGQVADRNTPDDYGQDNKRTFNGMTVNTYPDWFSQRGWNKQAVITALDKIIKDNGADKGKTVEKVKKEILDALQYGREQHTKLIKAGVKSEELAYTVPKDEEIADFLEEFKNKKVTTAELHKAYKQQLAEENKYYSEREKDLTEAEREYYNQLAEEQGREQELEDRNYEDVSGFFKEQGTKKQGDKVTKGQSKEFSNLDKYGWKVKTGDGIYEIYNANDKKVAYAKSKGGKYVIYNNSDEKILAGNKDLSQGIEKVAKEYFYAKEQDKEPEQTRFLPKNIAGMTTSEKENYLNTKDTNSSSGKEQKKEKKKQEKKAKIDKDIEDAWDEFINLGKNRVNSIGIDPQLLAAGMKIVGLYIKKGTYEIKDILRAAKEKLGNEFDKYYDSIKQAYSGYWTTAENDIAKLMTNPNDVRDLSLDNFNKEYLNSSRKEKQNDTDTGNNLESDSARKRAEDSVGENIISDGSGTDERSTGQRTKQDDKQGDGKQSGDGIRGELSDDSGKKSDTEQQEYKRVDGPEIAQGLFDTAGSLFGNDEGIRLEPDADITTADTPENEVRDSDISNDSLSREEKKKAQSKAPTNVVLQDIDNIRATLPYLLPSQHEDVHLAENRFFHENYAKPEEQYGKGILFTNQTGTGKTYVGLGIAKRFTLQGKNDILIVVPTDKKAKDWIEDGDNLQLKVNQLDNTTDKGKGIVVTTYANFRANENLQKRNFDLIIYDESHNIISNEAGKRTSADDAHKKTSLSPYYAMEKTKEEMNYETRLEEIAKPFIAAQEDTSTREIPEEIRAKYTADKEALKQELYDKAVETFKRTKVVFLSATPFSYHPTLKYADGYLFNMLENPNYKAKAEERGGYNSGNAQDRFYMQNFGYRMKYNKLTKPESGIDVGLMERNFTDGLRKRGVLGSRVLDVDKDYSRHFVTVNSKWGNMIDDAFDILSNTMIGDKKRFPRVHTILNKKFDYLYSSQMLEAAKAKEIIPRVKEHLAVNRKVVIFHSYNNAMPSHPFIITGEDIQKSQVMGSNSREEVLAEIDDFNNSYSMFAAMEMRDLANPIERFRREFGDKAVFYNGTVPKKQRDANIRKFNDDNSGTDIMVVQIQAGKEGISLHDMEGGKQRALICLALPIRPTDAIQLEGRIYRFGNASDAVIEYAILGNSTERFIYSNKIKERVKTAENLAMGSQARDLETAFREGYINPTEEKPGDWQGTGGKGQDKLVEAINEFDKAKTYYISRGKRTAKDKSREGTDYYGTPEPLGMKMVQWMGTKPNGEYMEPSGGHGAIARFFPGDATNTFIEQSRELASQMAVNATQGNVKVMSFEDFNIINKFDGIATNPPFGKGGKTAMEHLAKDFKHLKTHGRIVALVPQGSFNDKFDKWNESEEGEKAILRARILLPTVTFERAGTSVATQILIIDKAVTEKNWETGEYRTLDEMYPNLEPATNIDLRDIKKIDEFFDRIEDMDMPENIVTSFRSVLDTPKPQTVKDDSIMLEPPATENLAGWEKAQHTKTGKAIYRVFFKERLSSEQYGIIKKYASSYGGYWSSFKGNGAKPGFIMPDELSAQRVSDMINNMNANTGEDIPQFARVEQRPIKELPVLMKRLVKRLRQAFPGMNENDVVIESNTEDFLNRLRDEEGYDARNLDFAKKDFSPQRTQRNAKNFKKWFGDSKVVDKDGKPLVVYHGTNKDFTEFKENPKGIFFAKEKDVISDYPRNKVWGGKGLNGENIIPAYLKMENPLIVDENFMRNEFFKGWGFKEETMQMEVESFFNSTTPYRESVVNYAKEKGYDGLIIKDDYMPSTKEQWEKERIPATWVDSYVVFNPNQIKSATGNNGDFDINNNDIRFAKKGVMPVAYVGSDGRIHMDGSVITGEIPIHEFGHLWAKWAKVHAPEVLKQGFRLVEQDTDLMDEVRRLYPDLQGDRVYEEAVMMAIGRKGEGMYENILNESKRRNLIEKFKRWVKNLFDKIFKTEKTFEEWVEARVKDLFYGKFENFSPTNDTNKSQLEQEQSIAAIKKEKKEGFYSQLERVAEQKIQNNATPGQIKATLLNNGVKQAEYDWMGLDTFMAGKDKISKADLMEFIAENKVEMKEVVKGIGKIKFTEDSWDEGSSDNEYTAEIGNVNFEIVLGDDNVYTLYENGETLMRSKDLTKLMNYEGETNADDTKFSQWKLEGGKNYREVMLTLPDKTSEEFEPAKVKIQRHRYSTTQGDYEIYYNGKLIAKYGDDIKLKDGKYEGRTDEEIIQTAKNVFEKGDKYNNYKPLREGFHSPGSHSYGSAETDVNRLLHLRLQDFEAEGNKILLIDENQSDWGQEGRKEGYNVKPEDTQGMGYIDYRTKLHEKYKTKTVEELKNKATTQEYSTLRYLAQKEDVEGFPSAVPDFPFKKNWHEVGMKWALRYAAENGYDGIAWTPGEVQAERYDLSKQVNKVEWHRLTEEDRDSKFVGIDLKGGNYIKMTVDEDGHIGRDTSSGAKLPDDFVGKNISDAIGKEIAEKILKEERGELAGDGLKIGGKGMKGFYDKILPDFMNKYTKKWDSSVQSVNLFGKDILNDKLFNEDGEIKWKTIDYTTKSYIELPNGTYIEVNDSPYNIYVNDKFVKGGFENETERDEWLILSKYFKNYIYKGKEEIPVPYVEITPAMRNSVLFEGQALFARKGEKGLLSKGEADGLELAKRMDKRGMPEKEIFERTGWRKRLGDGKWSLESKSKEQTRINTKDTNSSSGIEQIETENFKKWFGDSKVVDKDGKPLVVYHGSNYDFTEFQSYLGLSRDIQDEGMFWFAKDKGEAMGYGKNLIVGFLKIENPGTEKDLNKIAIYVDKVNEKNSGKVDYEELNISEEAQKRGFDGFILKDKTGLDRYIVFNSNQIKSIDNTGTFDDTNPNIYFARIKVEGEGDWFEENRDGLDEIGKKILARYPEIDDAAFFEKMNFVLERLGQKERVTEEQSGVVLRGIQMEGMKEQHTTETTGQTPNSKENESTSGFPVQTSGNDKTGEQDVTTPERSNEGERAKSKKKVLLPGTDEHKFNVQVQRDAEIGQTEKDILDKDSVYKIKGNKETHAEATAKIEELGGDDAAYIALVEKGNFFRFIKSGYGSEDMDFIPAETKIEMALILMRRYADKVNKSGIPAQDILDGKADLQKQQALNKMLVLGGHLMDRGLDAGRAVQIFSTFSKLSPEGLLIYAKKMEKQVNRKKQKLTEQDIEGVAQQLQEENKKAIEKLIKANDKIKELERKLASIPKLELGNEEGSEGYMPDKDVEAAIKEYKDELEKYKKELKERMKNITTLERSNEGYVAEIKKLMDEIDGLTKKLEESEIKQKELEDLTKQLQGKIKELKDIPKPELGNEGGKGKKRKPTAKKQADEELTEEEKREERLTKAADKLAKKIADSFKLKGEDEQKKLINEMVKTLYGVAVEKKMVDEQEKQKEPIIQQIARAIKSETDYKEVWTNSKDIVKEKLADQFALSPENFDAAINRLEDYFLHDIKDAFTEKQVMRALRDQIKEDGVKVSEVIRKHYTVQEETARDLADKLIEKAGLTKEEAEGLRKEIEHQMQVLTAKAKAEALKRFVTVTPTERLQPKKKRVYQQLVEASNLGFLGNKEAFEILKRKYDWNTLTPENADRIMKYSEEIQALPEGSVQQVMKIAEMMNYIKNSLGFKYLEYHWSIMYANQLSGMFTHIKNVKYNLLNQAIEVFARNPKEILPALQGSLSGLSGEGITEFKFAMQHGTAGLGSKFENDDIAAQSITERYDWNTLKGKNPAVKAGLMYAKYVMRALYAEDKWSFSGFKEMEARAMADDIARYEIRTNEELNKLSKTEQQKYISARIQQIMNNSDKAVNAAKEQARTEGLQEGTTLYDKRVYQILEHGRPDEVVKATHKFGARGTLNYDPDGFIGGIYRMFEFFRKQPGGKASIYVLPYIRIVANVINNNLDFTPLGYKRAFWGKTGDETRPTPREKTAELYRATIGSTLLLGLAGLGYMLLGGDDDKTFDITAFGTGNVQRNKQLEETGWKPYSIKIKGYGWFSYLDSPIQFPLTLLGAIKDLSRYQKDKLEDETVWENISYIAIMMLSSTISQSFLSGVKDFIGAWDENNPDKAKRYLMKLGVGIATSYTVPNLIRQTMRMFDSNVYEANTIPAMYMRSWGIAESSLGLKQRLNVLGEPMKNDPTALHSKEENSPVWNFIIKNGAWISQPKEETIMYDPKLWNPQTGKNGMDRAMTQDEYYEFVKNSGQMIKQGIEKGMWEMDKIADKDRVRKYVKQLTATARDSAKERIAVKTENAEDSNIIRNFDKYVVMQEEINRINELAVKYEIKSKDGNEWVYKLEQTTEKNKGKSEKETLQVNKERVMRLVNDAKKTGNKEAFLRELKY